MINIFNKHFNLFEMENSQTLLNPNEPQKEVQSSEALLKAANTFKDISNFYMPSGKYDTKIFLTYLICSISFIILAQVVLFIVDGIVIFLNVAATKFGFALFLVSFGVGAFGYFYGGRLLALIFNFGTRYAKNRSVLIFVIFGLLSCVIAFILRLFIEYTLGQQVDIGYRQSNIFDKPESLYWFIRIPSFLITTFSCIQTGRAFIWGRAFCENCNIYLTEKTYLFEESNLLNILSELKDFKISNYKELANSIWETEEESLPHAKMLVTDCPTCKTGYLELYYCYDHIDKKNNKQRRESLLFTSRMNEYSFKVLNTKINNNSVQ